MGKKIINQPTDVVSEMINGIIATHSSLCVIEGFNVIMRADFEAFKKSGEVALISGGGSGHEPSHAGFIGQGMLSAAVLGGVFASPSTQQILQAIRHVSGPAGALLIVKNYTGDRLNFGIAQELAIDEGIPTELVIVADDVALVSKDIRRGLAGTLFVHKVAGAAAARGKSLTEVKKLALHAIQSIGTMGVGLGPCTLPGVEKAGFELGETEMELGLGIHGEPGVQKEALLPANGVVDRLLEYLAKDLLCGSTRRVAVLVNGLGSTPLMELYIVANRVKERLWTEYNVNVERMAVGNFMTALDMPGFSLSLLLLDDDILSLLEDATNAPSWQPMKGERKSGGKIFVPLSDDSFSDDPKATLANDGILYGCIKSVCHMFIEKESFFTELDRVAGDGDMGISMERGATAVLKELDSFPDTIPEAIQSLAICAQQHTGGTSGVLYAIFLLKMSAVLKQGDMSLKNISDAINQGAQRISELGGATVGDCTMLDALIPAVQAFGEGKDIKEALALANGAARKGSDTTISMLPAKGRAQYLGERAKNERDAGAEAICHIFSAISSQFS